VHTTHATTTTSTNFIDITQKLYEAIHGSSLVNDSQQTVVNYNY